MRCACVMIMVGGKWAVVKYTLHDSYANTRILVPGPLGTPARSLHESLSQISAPS